MGHLPLELNKTSLPRECTPLSENDIIQGLQRTDAEVFRRFYQMYSASLLGVIIGIVQNRETAEDILQESFIKISCKINSYNEHKSRLFTWILNIARHSAIDHLRRTATRNDKRTFDLEEKDLEIDNYQSYTINTDIIGLKKLLLNLSEKQQILLEMIYFQGYTHIETAERMGMPLGSVKTSVRNAMILLRGSFKERYYHNQSA